jgi:hypothetical protein
LAKVVDAVAMVGMVVSPYYRVEIVYLRIEQLFTKVGAGVD